MANIIFQGLNATLFPIFEGREVGDNTLRVDYYLFPREWDRSVWEKIEIGSYLRYEGNFIMTGIVQSFDLEAREISLANVEVIGDKNLLKQLKANFLLSRYATFDLVWPNGDDLWPDYRFYFI